MKDHYHATNELSWKLRFHTQTAGVSLTAQQPEINIARTAIEALAGVLGGTQSLHTNSMDEALALPSEKAARIALRTQQVIAYETNVVNVADPLGGSWFVEALTDEMAAEAQAIFTEIAAMGAGSMLEGCIKGIEENWFQGRIAESAYNLERSFNQGKSHRRRRERLHRRQRRRRLRDPSHHQRGRAQAGRSTRERSIQTRRRAGTPGTRSVDEGRRGSRSEPHAGVDQRRSRQRLGRRDDGRDGEGLRSSRRGADAVTVRVLVAKVGLDGHDRGIKVVARLLRDAGMEVVYTGLFQTPETVAIAAIQEDVDVVGLSMLSGAHLTLAPLVVEALRSKGSDIPVIVGGIVPNNDLEDMRAAGIAAVFGPGASADEMVASINEVVSQARA
jgi:methylmalonyl-CoA mutase cobalamin-binding domain/chain